MIDASPLRFRLVFAVLYSLTIESLLLFLQAALNFKSIEFQDYTFYVIFESFTTYNGAFSIIRSNVVFKQVASLPSSNHPAAAVAPLPTKSPASDDAVPAPPPPSSFAAIVVRSSKRDCNGGNGSMNGMGNGHGGDANGSAGLSFALSPPAPSSDSSSAAV